MSLLKSSFVLSVEVFLDIGDASIDRCFFKFVL